MKDNSLTLGGVWSTNLLELGGDGGIGVGAMLRTQRGQIMLFARNDYNGVSSTWQLSPNSSFQSTWLDLGGEIPAFRSAANDATGRVVMVAMGTDGRLYIRRETSSNMIGKLVQAKWRSAAEVPRGSAAIRFVERSFDESLPTSCRGAGHVQSSRETGVDVTKQCTGLTLVEIGKR